jgi:hypothetical protein
MIITESEEKSTTVKSPSRDEASTTLPDQVRPNFELDPLTPI